MINIQFLCLLLILVSGLTNYYPIRRPIQGEGVSMGCSICAVLFYLIFSYCWCTCKHSQWWRSHEGCWWSVQSLKECNDAMALGADRQPINRQTEKHCWMDRHTDTQTDRAGSGPAFSSMASGLGGWRWRGGSPPPPASVVEGSVDYWPPPISRCPPSHRPVTEASFMEGQDAPSPGCVPPPQAVKKRSSRSRKDEDGHEDENTGARL